MLAPVRISEKHGSYRAQRMLMAQSLCRRPPAHGLTRSVQVCFGEGLEPLEVERKGRITSFSENSQSCRDLLAEGSEETEAWKTGDA